MSLALEMIDGLDLSRLANAPVVVFGNVRNEIVRIQAWLDHYRRIGVVQFVVVDNGSSDGTYELLSDQADVIVIRTTESYAASKYGVSWLNGFRRRLTARQWILAVDADEFLVYRDWPRVTLLQFINRLDAASADAAVGFMLDMYPDGALSTASGAPKSFDELLRLAPMFDSRYVFTIKKAKPWAKTPRMVDVIGGPRIRLLSSVEKELRQGWLLPVLSGQIDRVIDKVPDSFLPFLARHWPRQVPRLTKVPLAKGGAEIQFINSHSATAVHPYCENVVLLHFKYLADFGARVAAEIGRKEHYRRGLEYLMYAQILDQRGDISFKDESSVRLVSADDLAATGLIRNIFYTYVYS